MRTELVTSALNQALFTRQRIDATFTSHSLVHHCDAGSQYLSVAFTEELHKAGIIGSIGTVGDALDNAVMESTIGLFKTEVIDFERTSWTSWRQVEAATASWVNWYNCETFSGWSGTGWQDGDWLFHPAGVTLGTTDFNVFSVDLSVCGAGWPTPVRPTR